MLWMRYAAALKPPQQLLDPVYSTFYIYLSSKERFGALGSIRCQAGRSNR